MRFLAKLVCVWGMLDSIWMASQPQAWGDFWGGVVAFIREGRRAARVMAGVQLLACICLFNLLRRRRRGHSHGKCGR